MRILLFVIVFSTLIFQTAAQELNPPQLSQYLSDNPFVLSPTYAGIGDYVKIRLNGLTQWVGVKNAPDTQSLAADVRLGERSGIGLFVYNDKNGYTAQQGARVSFAHHLTLNEETEQFLSLGVSYNFNQFRLDVNEYMNTTGDFGLTGERSISNHNFEVGALYRLGNFYLNLNVSNILPKDLTNFNPEFEPSNLRNYYVYSGYRFRKTPRSTLEIEPSILFKLYESDGRSETDLNLKFRFYDFEDYYYIGLNYRFLNDQLIAPLYVAPILGLKKGNLYFGYSYQIILNEISQYNTGTHVVTLGINLFQGISNCSCTY
ncbi:PorP/SprF family type IX secretion system membrane protein [Maribacter sp. IgM3_T14_3]|uniref:PorP/SprF family type IX secretion system membrane protein n=1 Tax=Maribacter sp. IgM3_T14_3 TaxID=3415140 RepID=UPI003C6FCDA8